MIDNENQGENINDTEEDQQQEAYMEYIEKLKENNQDLYDHIVNNGKSEGEAIDMLVVLEQQRDQYMEDSLQVELPRVIPMNDILKHTDWGNMNTTQKQGLLWNLGIDTKKHKFHTDTRRIRDSDKKLVLTEVVWGKERLDREWLNTRHPLTGALYASEEAIGLAYTKDRSGFWC